MEFFIGIVAWFAAWVIPGVAGIIFPEANSLVGILGPGIVITISGIIEYRKNNRLDGTFVLAMACAVTAVLGAVGAADLEAAIQEANQEVNEALLLGMLLPGALWWVCRLWNEETC